MTEPSRRSVVKGAAWSVPVIAMGAAVPAAAASPTSGAPQSCDPVFSALGAFRCCGTDEGVGTQTSALQLDFRVERAAGCAILVVAVNPATIRTAMSLPDTVGLVLANVNGWNPPLPGKSEWFAQLTGANLSPTLRITITGLETCPSAVAIPATTYDYAVVPPIGASINNVFAITAAGTADQCSSVVVVPS